MTERIDLEKGTITYVALPYPLPEVWQKELMFGRCKSGIQFDAMHKDNIAESIISLKALMALMKGSIGFVATKKYIPPISGKLERYMG